MKRIGLAAVAACIAMDGVGAQTTPAASGWETLPTERFPGKRDDISFGDARHGWYGTGKGDLFATSDGGATWTKVWSKPGTFIRALGFVDARTGFVANIGPGYYPGVTDPVPLYRTDDGGRTLTPVNVPAGAVAGICAVDVLKTERIFQGRLTPTTVITAAGRVGGPAGMIRSTDGGATWQVIDMSRWTGMILDVRFLTEQVGFVAASTERDVRTTQAQILMTRDGGRSWREVYRGKRAKELVWKMSFPTARVGYATVQSYDQTNPDKLVVKTTDGGRSWKELPLAQDPKLVTFGIGFADERRGWVGTTVGGFETRDGGKTFARVPIAPAANKVRVVRTPGGAGIVSAIGTQVQKLAL